MTDESGALILTIQSSSIEAYVDAASTAIGLVIDPAFRAGVVAAFEHTQQAAEVVMSFPLPEEVDIAPIFVP